MTLSLDACPESFRRSRTRLSEPTPRVGRWIPSTGFMRLAGRILDYARKRRMMAELQALDDRTLKDIGITRCEIPYHVHGPLK